MILYEKNLNSYLEIVYANIKRTILNLFTEISLNRECILEFILLLLFIFPYLNSGRRCTVLSKYLPNDET